MIQVRDYIRDRTLVQSQWRVWRKNWEDLKDCSVAKKASYEMAAASGGSGTCNSASEKCSTSAPRAVPFSHRLHCVYLLQNSLRVTAGCYVLTTHTSTHTPLHTHLYTYRTARLLPLLLVLWRRCPVTKAPDVCVIFFLCICRSLAQ